MSNALYDLKEIRQLASAGKVAQSRRVQIDTQNLGYAVDDINACIASLTESEFHKVEDYGEIQCDVYLTKYCGSSGYVDPLYVKLLLPKNATVLQVMLVSVHRPR